MTVERRHHLVVALVAAIAGAGIGFVASEAGINVEATLAWWLGVLGVLALVLVLLTAPAEPEADPAETSAREGWAEFRRELRRSRRASRPMTLLRLPGPASPDAAAAADLPGRTRLLHEHLRLVDRTWIDEGSIYVLLPESPRASAEALLGRLATVAPDVIPDGLRIATFPDDGLTSGAIISALHGADLTEIPTPLRAAVAEEEPVVAAPAVDDERPAGGAAARS